MSPPIITLQSRPGIGHRPAVGGVGIGPWLDRKSARFLVEWLDLSKADMGRAEVELRIEVSLLEALGISSEPEPAAIPAPQDAPLAIESRP